MISRMLQWSTVDEGVDGVGLHSCVDGARYCVCYNQGHYVGVLY